MRPVLYPGTRKALPHPWRIRLFAARGLLPPSQAELVHVFLTSRDAQERARAALGLHDPALRPVRFAEKVKRLGIAVAWTIAALVITLAALSPLLVAAARL